MLKKFITPSLIYLGLIHLPHLRCLTDSFINFWTSFSLLFAKFLPFFKVEYTDYWKIIKNGKNLAKKINKTCPEIYIKYLQMHKWGRWIRHKNLGAIVPQPPLADCGPKTHFNFKIISTKLCLLSPLSV